mmetsp:Transcript_5577/g.15047  ORF Transcript_5577/g.15047 Transcript_5577/m.15047 type:complete len:231 (+) Transcript_5577:73-765(+)
MPRAARAGRRSERLRPHAPGSPSLSPSSRIRMNSSSVKLRTRAASMCARCRFKTSMSFICFLKAFTSSERCRSSFRISPVRRSVSRRSDAERSLSWLPTSLSCAFRRSPSSTRRLRRASLVLLSASTLRACTSTWFFSFWSSPFSASSSFARAVRSATCFLRRSLSWPVFWRRLFSSDTCLASCARWLNSVSRLVSSVMVLSSSSCSAMIRAFWKRMVVWRASVPPPAAA